MKRLLAILLYCGAVFFVRGNFQDTHILLETPIQGADVKLIQQQEGEEAEPMGFCFWAEKSNQTVSCRETGGTAQVNTLFLAGNPGLLDAPELSWQAGCLVDEDTARELFGTATVGQQVLWYGETAYPVLGIAEAAQPTVILPARPEDSLHRLVLPLPPEQGSIEGPRCLNRWALSGSVLDTTLLWSICRDLLLIFPAVLLGRLSKRAGKLRWIPIAVLLWQFAVVPKAMLPSRWSDFSFWGRWWEGETENALALLLTPLGNRQLQILQDVVKSVVMNIAACLLLIRRKRDADFAD